MLTDGYGLPSPADCPQALSLCFDRPGKVTFTPMTRLSSHIALPLIAAASVALMLASACRPQTASITPTAPAEVQPTLTATALPPTPVPAGTGATGTLTTPQAVDLLRPSVVQIAVLKSGGKAVGTGVVYDTAGHILTNWHVVNGAISIQVSFSDESVAKGSLFQEDPANDLAIILADRAGLRPATLGDSDKLEVGEDVIAIGHALGLPGGPTVSKGVVSALDRAISGEAGQELTGLIQTDAAINEGNSGGPLVNAQGEVIGINTVRISGGAGIGFAMNINTVKETAARLLALGPPPPSGYLGAFGSDITLAMAVVLRLPVSDGLGIESVDSTSPAQTAGVRVDDIIVGMNEARIRTAADLAEFLRKNQPGTKVRVRLVRGDPFSGFSLITVDLTLGRSEAS